MSKVAKAKPAAPRITRPAKAAKPTPKPAVKVGTSTKVAKPAATQLAPKPTTKATPPLSKPAAPTPTPVVSATSARPTSNGSHKTAAETPKTVTKSLIPKPAPKSLAPRDAARDSAPRSSAPMAKDRILLAVSNPYWLNAYWEISAHSIQRAEAALRQDWHGSRMIIRLFDVTSLDTTSTSETPVKDVIIHGPGQNWYIDVPQPPRMYRADIGYVSRRGEFYVLARSNVVTPPKAGGAEPGTDIESEWDDNDAKWKAERILAMSTGFESTGNPELRELFEERLGRPLGPPKETAFGTGATPPGSVKKFFFEIDAKLIVFGRTDPAAHLTLNNDPIKLNPDGTFRMTFNLPDSRQIIPAVAASADGVEERTIVLAVERNTKHLDPMIHDQMNEV
ncbi:DUF4912 domain-containing protein [Frigoriglobus tundricola]|uniref:DUF4912 domain-containing protein n=1 Tax=Frigoriglobus tundricola TaxID=2774151 RepID=UPI00148EAC6E|nr:DUF4912 domain-containing protein [Frigoriglobus tundricola]